MKNDWLVPVIENLEENKFYGKLVVNFCQGDVSMINKEESILKPQKPKQETDRELV
ncbi:MAG: hypothetical protein ABSE82_07410 [Nitrososphaerales archaeon]|jgi:hypothetical protein